MNKLTPLALGLTLALSSLAQAEGYRQHDAHVHGEVEINIAQDGKELLVEITAPGADVVGFEHAPKNHDQEHKLEDAIKRLNTHSDIFSLANNAGCKIEHKSVTHTLGEDSHEGHDHDKHDHHDDHEGHDHDKHDHHDDHEGHDHDKHDHHDDHEGHDHDKHDHHDDHEDHDHDKHDHHDDHEGHEGHDHDKHEGGHGEFTIEYHYECSDVSKLDVIETQWFTHFPSTESIHVNILTDTTQAAMDLGKGQTQIKL